MRSGHFVSCRKLTFLLLGGLLCSGCDRGPEGEESPAGPQQSTIDASSPVPGSTFENPVGVSPGIIPEPDLPDNPYYDEVEAIEEGRELFVAYNCYGCHGGRGGGGMGPSLRDEVWIYGQHPADIFDSIAEGRPNAMPAWGMSLPPEIIWKITAYIQSLRTELEPNAPRPREQTETAEDGREAGGTEEGRA